MWYLILAVSVYIDCSLCVISCHHFHLTVLFKRPSEKICVFLFFDWDVMVALKPDTILNMLPVHRLGILFILNQRIQFLYFLQSFCVKCNPVIFVPNVRSCIPTILLTEIQLCLTVCIIHNKVCYWINTAGITHLKVQS